MEPESKNAFVRIALPLIRIKTGKTFKVDIGDNKIPHNLQIYNIEFDMFNFNIFSLISDYHIVEINTHNKVINIQRKNYRIINLISVVNRKSKKKIYYLFFIYIFFLF